jgi:hypothetical protein
MSLIAFRTQLDTTKNEIHLNESNVEANPVFFLRAGLQSEYGSTQLFAV